ncbi:TIM-barrel domain-containing protein [Streptobacillus felis]|uniref:glycoside hydrolase family 31 protein n=1 Tax=Streptobacillus felis TaxID=1384509 RepID=UPI00083296B8|nr:TIM-barrel domain-containing protein [Streptobacillus felis]
MIFKYRRGNPIKTDSTVMYIESNNELDFFNKTIKDKKILFDIDENTFVYGLGGSNRGINKIGYTYTSYCSDDPVHTEDKTSLYAAQNFFVIKNKKDIFGIFIDSPSKITYDVGFTEIDKFNIEIESEDYDIYYIKSKTILDIVKEFRKLVGRSYIPPRWAFGYGQSRWGYMNEEDIVRVYDKHYENNIGLDMIYLDIDYMDNFKDFTINKERFPDLEKLVKNLKNKNVRLIPIIDAGVKIEKGYDVYEEGVKKGYFCKDEKGNDFVGSVWPGLVHFPDFLNKDAREWFGMKYKYLIDKGIEGFWNDMNEPAIFFTDRGIENMFSKIEKYRGKKDIGVFDLWEMKDSFMEMNNSDLDYKKMYHNLDGNIINHYNVHNLYGYNMTRSAGEMIEKISPEERKLLFSRASFIGMHRYGGIWTGDNFSWWSHILLSMQQMVGLNMCGFMYIGSDIGGFSGNCSEDLMMRWLEFATFTPLMRNHSAIGTRNQELYQYKNINKLSSIIDIRYRLLPYIYSTFMKCVLRDEMYFKPLAFEFDDEISIRIDDQLLIGDEIMIAPVYKANQNGRIVYLPEEMKMVKFKESNVLCEEILEKGHHYIKTELDEFCIFIRKGKKIPYANIAKNESEVNFDVFNFLGYDNATYEYYNDNGIVRKVSEKYIKTI